MELYCNHKDVKFYCRKNLQRVREEKRCYNMYDDLS